MLKVQILVMGRIDERWSQWLDGLDISYDDRDRTVLTGDVADQAALYGLVAKLRDLGLPLSSVNAGEEAAVNDLPAWQPQGRRAAADPDSASEPADSAWRREQGR